MVETPTWAVGALDAVDGNTNTDSGMCGKKQNISGRLVALQAKAGDINVKLQLLSY
jgi:hypothetical protein